MIFKKNKFFQKGLKILIKLNLKILENLYAVLRKKYFKFNKYIKIFNLEVINNIFKGKDDDDIISEISLLIENLIYGDDKLNNFIYDNFSHKIKYEKTLIIGIKIIRIFIDVLLILFRRLEKNFPYRGYNLFRIIKGKYFYNIFKILEKKAYKRKTELYEPFSFFISNVIKYEKFKKR